MKLRNFKPVLFCFILTLLCSCQEELDNASLYTGDVRVKMALRASDYVSVNTRSGMDERKINDVLIVQYKNGQKCATIKHDNWSYTGAVELQGLHGMAEGGDNALFFMVNFKATTGDFLDAPDNLDEFEGVFKLSGIDDLTGMNCMPMVGSYRKALTEGAVNNITVDLTPSLSKIKFNLTVGDFTHNGYPVTPRINKIELRNIPLEMTCFREVKDSYISMPTSGSPGSWTGGMVPYPAISDPKRDCITLTPDCVIADNTYTFETYVTENARGSYPDIPTNYEKKPESKHVPAGSQYKTGWTYVYVDLDFNDNAGGLHNATYKIYLGTDNAADINILGGVHYTVTTNLRGANELDTRITFDTAIEPTASIEDSDIANVMLHSDLNPKGAANSYIINDGSDIITIPLIQARRGWRHIQQSLSRDNDNTDYVGLFDQLIQSGKWEITTLWKTWPEANVNVTGTVADQGKVTANWESAYKYYATLTGLGTVNRGHNCVVVLRSTEPIGSYPKETVWWSWHMWFTDYNPDLEPGAAMNGQVHTYFGNAFREGGIYSGKKMMDRNLGATVNMTSGAAHAQPISTADAVKWYGMMYQYGRKDPFTPSNDGTATMTTAILPVYNALGTQIIHIADKLIGTGSNGEIRTDATENSKDGFPKVNSGTTANRLIDATRYPMVYFHSGPSSNWTMKDNTLWAGSGIDPNDNYGTTALPGELNKKTAFDPCPPGWRVPFGGQVAIHNPWAGFANGDPSSTASSTGTVFEWKDAIGIGTAGRMYKGSSVGASSTGGYGTDRDVWYPAAGNRSSSSGAFSTVGTLGYYWSTAVTGNSGYSLYFYSSSVNPANYISRAMAMPVRCVSE